MWQWLDCGVLLARMKTRLDMLYLCEKSIVSTGTLHSSALPRYFERNTCVEPSNEIKKTAKSHTSK